MPRKIKLKSGGYEWIDTKAEKESKEKYKKAKKDATKLTTKDLQELVFELARRANLI